MRIGESGYAGPNKHVEGSWRGQSEPASPLWTYVRDDRPAGDSKPPALWFACSPNRKGVHPQQHLCTFHPAVGRRVEGQNP